MNFRKIHGHNDVFVDESSGVLFTVKDGKDVPLKVWHSRNRKPFVNIKGQGVSVLDILLATYDFKFSDTDQISFKINKLGYITPASIKIKSSGNINCQENEIGVKYKCRVKASSANSRFPDKISAGTVLQILIISEFKCVYCGCEIDPDNWHLDHCHPKAFGGANRLENIAPACSICNLMKGSLDVFNFLRRCKRICLNNKMMSAEEHAKFNNEWDKIVQHSNNSAIAKKSYKQQLVNNKQNSK